MQAPGSGVSVSPGGVTLWSPGEIDVQVVIDSGAVGDYTFNLTATTGVSGSPFLAQNTSPSQPTGGNGRIKVLGPSCPTGFMTLIALRPFTLTGAFPDPGYPYNANLYATSSGNGAFTVSYQWSTDNPTMVGFDFASGFLSGVRILKPGRATITVIATLGTPCGNVTSQDSLTVVFSDDVTVVGWIDSSVIQLPDEEVIPIRDVLNAAFSCGVALASWTTAGQLGT